MRFQVLFHSPPGVLFTFPSRYWFTIGLWRVFSLGGWSRQIHTGFHVSRATRVSYGRLTDLNYGAITLCGPPFLNGSSISKLGNSLALCSQPVRSHNPRDATPACLHATGLGWSPFARRYLGNHGCFLFQEVLRCFSSLRWPPQAYVFSKRMTRHDSRRVFPFGDRRVYGCLHLTDAYRSLPRPSSPSRA